jgi:hypothetical protein
MKRLAIALLLVALASLAQAAQPIRYTDEFPGFEVFFCDGFDVINDGWVRFEVTDFIDDEGYWIRTQIHSTVLDDFYRADDPAGTHLTGTARANHRIAPGSDGHMYWTQAGNALNVSIIIPGYGPIFRDVGRIVMDMDSEWEVVFEAGSRHDLQFLNELLCEYFE